MEKDMVQRMRDDLLEACRTGLDECWTWAMSEGWDDHFDDHDSVIKLRAILKAYGGNWEPEPMSS